MALFASQNPWVLTFGLLGNIVSFVVFLAPIPTFVSVWKKKSTEGYQSFPYLVALLSAMLWIYYATNKSDAFLLITINSVGCVIETIYIAIYIAFAPKQARMLAVRILVLMNFGGFCLVIFVSQFIEKRANRIRFLGWVNLALAVSVFAAPLSIMRLVIRTKSVEFMPFYLSFFLTLNAIMWLFYGILLKDFYIEAPNILGFIFGVIQMVLYVIYKNCKQPDQKDTTKQLPQCSIDIAKLTSELQQVDSKPENNSQVDPVDEHNGNSVEGSATKETTQ